MVRKIMAEITQPVHDPVTGEVTHQPGTQLEENDKLLRGLPPSMYRFVVVDSDGKPSKQPAESGSASDAFSVKKGGTK